MRNRIRNKVVRTRFGPETCFEVGPLTPAPVPVRGPAEIELEQLKERLLGQMLASAADPGLTTVLRRAANEAASVAWFTPYPLLAFPTLLEEKAANARRQQERQQEIRRQTRGLLEEALSE
jgi:hypothetical protein